MFKIALILNEFIFCSSIDARELRKAMRTLGFKIPKASLEAMISKKQG